MTDVVPVVLFAYSRPHHLERTLAALRANAVPLIYAFSDGPRSSDMVAAVEGVRAVLKAVDWTDLRLNQRETNLGLGTSIRSGVSEVLAQHESVIVTEDDLVFVPGAYRYLSEALRAYRDEPRVMSVTGWTHRRVAPRGLAGLPYFDGRAECLLWGTWARAWKGMDSTALALLQQCERRGIDPYRYGADLPAQAQAEGERNLWAVRFLYHHLLQGGLCLRPPHSMVEHIGYDQDATNAKHNDGWTNAPLRPCPALPNVWPSVIEHPQCPELWRLALGGKPGRWPGIERWARRARRVLSRR